MRNPYTKDPLIGRGHTIAEVGERNVYLICRGREIGGIGISAQVHDMLAKDDKGETIPPTIILVCPRCGKNLRIDGYAKGVTVQYYSKPEIETYPNGMRVEQTCVVSVREAMLCPHDENGAPCGLRFRLSENVISGA